MDRKLLEKYFAGKASPEEQATILNFFRTEQPDYQKEEILREWWLQYLAENEDEKVESRILQKIHQEMNRESVRQRRLTPWLKIAAMLLIFFSAVLFIYKISGLSSDKAIVASVEMVNKETPMGAKLQITLPDGSRVYLNSGSKITYPAQFDGNQRVLNLSGEAYFEVAHDTLKPFIVNCRQVATRVLGTSFNLSGYKGQDVSVSLTSGKVQVNVAQQPPVFLQPGEELSYNTENENVQVNNFDPYTVTGWKDGILIFEENSLSQIIMKLERWYGVDVQVTGVADPANLSWNYSGEFENENLDNVLSGIAYVKGFDYEIDGKQVTLQF